MHDIAASSPTTCRRLIHFPVLKYMYPIPPLHLVCARLSPPLALAFSHSLHRHPYLCIPLISRFIRYNKQKKPSTHFTRHNKKTRLCPIVTSTSSWAAYPAERALIELQALQTLSLISHIVLDLRNFLVGVVAHTLVRCTAPERRACVWHLLLCSAERSSGDGDF